jgi:hypothetical protein
VKNNVRRIALYLLLWMCAGGAEAASIVISDGGFDDADWELSLFNFHTGGVVTAVQSTTGGNPDANRHVVHTINNATDPNDNAAIYSFHGYTPITVNPTTAGAILTVDFYWDVRAFLDAFGSGSFAGPALHQGDKFYVSAGLLDFNGTNQNWRSVERLGLVEANFGLIQDILEIDPAQDPDFSSSGEAITFGFFSALAGANGGQGFTMTNAYDNWRVEVTTVPIPATVWLFVSALGLLGWIRRKVA